MIAFDIETGPNENALELMPAFVPPPHPGEFFDASVKLGNLKDPAKIREKIEAARAAHLKSVAEHEQNVEDALESATTEWMQKAALDPTTGRVLCVGFQSAKGFTFEGGDSEEELLRFIWSRFSAWCGQRKVCGWNSRQFDLPFLYRRSVILGVDVPRSILAYGGGRWVNWSDSLVDLRDVWLCGQSASVHPSSLDYVARSLGLAGKPEGVTGADFARLWVEDQAAAVAYLQSDLAATYGIACRLFPAEAN